MAVSTGVSGSLCTLGWEGALGAAGGEGLELLAESRTFTLTENQALIDLTNRDSNWWSQFIAGIRDWEISGDGLYIYSDIARRRLQYHYTHRIPAQLTVVLTLAAGVYVFTAHCILTNFTYPAPHDDAATISFTLKGTDELISVPVS